LREDEEHDEELDDEEIEEFLSSIEYEMDFIEMRIRIEEFLEKEKMKRIK